MPCVLARTCLIILLIAAVSGCNSEPSDSGGAESRCSIIVSNSQHSRLTCWSRPLACVVVIAHSLSSGRRRGRGASVRTSASVPYEPAVTGSALDGKCYPREPIRGGVTTVSTSKRDDSGSASALHSTMMVIGVTV